MDSSLLLWVQVAILASVRLGLGLAMTPLFSSFGVPMMARLILMLTLAGLAASSTPAEHMATVLLEPAYFFAALANEVAVGLLLSVGVHASFAAFATAGRLIDAQMGFTLGAVLDPVSRGHAAVIASGFNMLAVVLFFVTDAHHALMTAYFQSFELLPVGNGLAVQGWLPLAEGAGTMFAMGFVMASPVVVALLLADVVVAVVSRNMPQMNVMFLSIPLKVLMGMAVMAVAVKLLMPVAQDVLMLPLHMLDKVR